MIAKSITLTPARLIGGLAFCPVALLPAIEPPPEDARPPAALLGEELAGNNPAAKLPFLGLSTAAIPEVVAEHLGIGADSGVIVRTVCPDSPAAEARLAVNDIILSINGSRVSDPGLFSEKIRAHKAGDNLEIELIRKGRPEKAQVTLTERPAELSAHLDAEPFLEGLPRAQAERLRGLMEQNLQGFGGDQPGMLPDQRFENTFRMLREQMSRALEQEVPPITQGEDGGIRFQQNSTIRLMDNEGSVEIKSSNGDTRVTVRDTANNPVWQGPWNSDKDKEAAPKDIRERIDRVNVGSAGGKGFTFRFGKPDSMEN